MVTGIFLFSVGISILALSVWFRFAKTALTAAIAQKVLGLALLFMGGSSFFLGLPFEQQVQYLLFDLLLVGLSGVIGALFAARPKILSSLVSGLILLLFPLHRALLWPSYAPSGLDPSGELLLSVSNGKLSPSIQKVLDKWDIRAIPAFSVASPDITNLDDYWVLDVPDRQASNMERIIAAVTGQAGVVWLEPNEILTLDHQVAPLRNRNAPSLVNDPGVAHLWGFDLMEMEKLYQLLESGEVQVRQKALIAILDSGVDADHEDISDNYMSTKAAYDKDPLGHGTHCAGIAGAVSNNGKGIASFSLDNEFVQITSIKVLGANGSGTQKGIIAGIIEAADRGAAVISMSLGGRSTQSRQQAYQDAVKYASQKGAVVVAAAGNSGQNAKDYAPVNTPGVIGVAALDTLGRKADFSNTVQDIRMAVAAPGVQIYSTIPGNQYASFNGTSMATPHVAGVIGLLKSMNPNLNTQEVFELIHQTGAEVADGDLTGRVMVPYRAVQALLENKVMVPPASE
jgi:thermitase